jgi:hypothetical protein
VLTKTVGTTGEQYEPHYLLVTVSDNDAISANDDDDGGARGDGTDTYRQGVKGSTKTT